MEPRFYEQIYPNSGNITIALIKEIKEMGAYVFLSEYGNTMGMLLMSELSRRRVRSINKLIKTGKTEFVFVIRVDHQKGYIDLSKRRIAGEENFFMEKKWIYSRISNSIFNHVSKIKSFDNEDCRIRWGWLLYRKFGHAVRSFKKFNEKNCLILKNIDTILKESSKLFQIIKKKLPATFQKISSDFEITCFSSKGVFDLKEIITQGTGENQCKLLSIKLNATPVYNVSVKGESKKKAIKLLLRFFKNISKKILGKKSVLLIKTLIFF